jgi:polysaccharide deacetylase 2 family uncharacterized protein YibQ
MHATRTRSIYIGLSLLALVCVLGLDYIRSQRDGEAWLFRARTSEPQAAWTDRTPGDLVLGQVQAMGIPQEKVSQYRDSEGIHHMMLELTLEQYWDLESRLDRELPRAQAQASKSRREQGEGKTYFLWQIEDRNKQLLSLLVSCRIGPGRAGEEARPEQPLLARNKVAIIIDDMGNSLDAIEEVSRLGQAITVAVLPYSRLAQETAAIAHQNNLEVILHLPLESLYNFYDNNHTQGIIHSGMDADEIIRAVEESLGQVPYIDGVNTHMGSKITSDAELIRIVLVQLKNRGLYFIDSRTTAESVAFDEAQRMEIPSAFRNVFLDSEIEEDFIRSQLIRLFRHAQQNGSAVGICHPSPETLKVLRENLHLVERYGLQTVFASEVVQ